MKWKLTAVIVSVLILGPLGAYFMLDPETQTLDETARKQLGGTCIQLSHGITHYKLEGEDDGKPVVLVHGATIPIWTWDGLASDLVSAGRRVLSYDMFGRGYSDRPHVIYDQTLYRQQIFELAIAVSR